MPSLSMIAAHALSAVVEHGRRGHWSAQRLFRRVVPGRATEVTEAGLDVPHFFRKHVIFHTHVEKAAGTTLVESLKSIFGPHRIHDIRTPAARRPAQLSPREKAAVWVLTGHFHYGRMDRFFARQPVYIACVRHPVTRFFSYYKYVSSSPDHPGYEAMAGKSFDDVVMEYARSHHHSITNPMSRMLTGRRIPSYDTIIPHVEKNYLIVAPQERVDDLVATFFRVFAHEQRAAVRRRNVGGYNDEPSSKAKEIILERNQADLRLYEYACRRFDIMRDQMIRRMSSQTT